MTQQKNEFDKKKKLNYEKCKCIHNLSAQISLYTSKERANMSCDFILRINCDTVKSSGLEIGHILKHSPPEQKQFI